jgi:Holliday junction resolvasome RuvABC endonuclease subunit
MPASFASTQLESEMRRFGNPRRFIQMGKCSSLTVAEYAANLAKKTLTGTGHAEKSQIAMTVGILVPGSGLQSADAALMRSPWQSPMPHTGIAP